MGPISSARSDVHSLSYQSSTSCPQRHQIDKRNDTMGIIDSFKSGETSGNTAKGVNDIPAPRSDASVNAPPPEQHKRVYDFVRVRHVLGDCHPAGRAQPSAALSQSEIRVDGQG